MKIHLDVLKIHPPRVQLACGTMWLQETANHCSSFQRTACHPKFNIVTIHIFKHMQVQHITYWLSLFAAGTADSREVGN